MDKLIQTVRELCDLPGVSGQEQAVRADILKRIEGLAGVESKTDALGNLIVFKKGRRTPKNRVMFAAHMDEVGFLVTYIDQSGLLRFSTVGGIDTAVIAGKPVLVGEKQLPGVVGLRPVHLRTPEQKKTLPSLDDLYIDIGCGNAEEAQRLVELGDRVLFDSPFTEFGDGMLMGRALDDRAGCALLLTLLERELEYDCYFAFTVQEETGLAGAKAASYQIKPDISIVVETTSAGDVPGASGEKKVCSVKKGPVISYMDRGTVYDAELYRLAFACAGEHGIPCQTKTGVFGGNDSIAIQVSRGGVRAMAVSLPCRYLHSPSCVLSREDLFATRNLLGWLAEAAAQA